MAEENLLIGPNVIIECNEPNDKHYQEFKLFLSQGVMKKYIKGLRIKGNIHPKDINARLQEYKKLVKVKDVKKSKSYWSDFYKHISRKLLISDVRLILKILNKPVSWEYPLSCFILTNEIITPSVRCEMRMEEDKIVLNISAEATARDIRDAFKRVKTMQPLIQGYGIKKMRYKTNLEEKVSIAKDQHRYISLKNKMINDHDDPILISNKAIARLELVDKYKPNAFEKVKQKREEARQRQIYHRYKKHI